MRVIRWMLTSALLYQQCRSPDIHSHGLFYLCAFFSIDQGLGVPIYSVSDHDPLNLIERNLVAGAVVELGGAIILGPAESAVMPRVRMAKRRPPRR
jgi:hypothetical protein